MPAAVRTRGACSVTNEPDVSMGAFLRSPAQGSHRVNPGTTSRCGQTVQLLNQHGELPGVEDGIRERADTGEHGELRPVDLCERLVPGDAMPGPSQNGPGLVTNLQVDHRAKLSLGEPTAHPIWLKPGSAGVSSGRQARVTPAIAACTARTPTGSAVGPEAPRQHLLKRHTEHCTPRSTSRHSQ